MTITIALIIIIIPQTIADCNAQATATFDGAVGVEGTVVINTDGDVNVDLSIMSLDTSICTGDVYPLSYHIHQIWNSSATNAHV